MPLELGFLNSFYLNRVSWLYLIAFTNMTKISRTEFARRQGISKGRVSQLVAKGMPIHYEGIDSEEALGWMLI